MTVELERIDDHVARAIAMIVQQFKGKPNFEAVLTAFIQRVQEVEDMLHDVWQARMLDNASGARLDGLGSIVGIEREGDTDTVYKVRIRARIFSNVSRGTADDIMRIASLLGGTNVSVSYSEVYEYPAAFALTLAGIGVDGDSVAAVFAAVASATPAGVALSLLYSLAQPENTFTFSSTADTNQSDAGRGFGGGLLAGLLSNG